MRDYSSRPGQDTTFTYFLFLAARFGRPLVVVVGVGSVLVGLVVGVPRNFIGVRGRRVRKAEKVMVTPAMMMMPENKVYVGHNAPQTQILRLVHDAVCSTTAAE